MGAAYLDPLQHNRARLVPSLLTLYCQCGLNMVDFNSLLTIVGLPNICRSSNWLSCLVSPLCHRSHVDSVFNFFRVKQPSACSSGVVSLDCIACMRHSISSVVISASSCD